MRRGTATILAGGLLLAGCGSDDPPQDARQTADARLTVIETEYALEPASAQVARGGRVTVTATNRGEMAHALAVDTGAGTEASPTIAPGSSGTLSVRLEPGAYTWYCPIRDHRRRGMTGTLRVGGDQTPAKPPPRPSSGGGLSY